MSRPIRTRPPIHLPSRPVASALLAAALLSATILPSGARASYQASVDSNKTAFSSLCIGWDDPHPARMLALAVSGFKALGYDVSSYSGTAFTRAGVLSRTFLDWGFYVHSHGDFYWNPTDQRRYTGFRDDGGKCVQSIVYSKDIAARRLGRQSNLVLISTCDGATQGTTMPGAFAIEKVKAGTLSWNGPEFYIGYVGTAYDNDEETFETAFWDALVRGSGAGRAFELGLLGYFTHPFDADWWGSYIWMGRAGPGTVCRSCL